VLGIHPCFLDFSSRVIGKSFLVIGVGCVATVTPADEDEFIIPEGISPVQLEVDALNPPENRMGIMRERKKEREKERKRE
jgi:hypothetical protein